MKTNSNIFQLSKISVAFFSLLLIWSCERDLKDLQEASNPTNGDIFIDGFSPGLQYASFGGAVPEAFQVDKTVSYNNSAASMSFAVPDVNDPNGAYAGGSFFTAAPRDLSGYNTLSFWIKATQPASIDVVGFGNDFGANKYQVSISGLNVNTNWKKVYIPSPNAAKLTSEKGMFFISEGPENGRGYTFWIDDLKFEKLGTILPLSASIMNGTNVTRTTFVGVTSTVTGVITTFNMPNGINQSVSVAPAYLNFVSSNPSVATVNDAGVVTPIAAGTATITATFNGQPTTGSLIINCTGTYINAPTPTLNPANVISIFSDAYTNVPVEYYNGYWQPWQTTVSNDFSVLGDNVLNYTNFNFVGIEFDGPTVNATSMTHFHMDAFIPGPIAPGRQLRVIVVDFGADGVFGGGDDTRHSTTFTAPTLVSQNWIPIEIPFSAMPGLLSRTNLAQIILEGGDNSILYVDNVYFHN